MSLKPHIAILAAGKGKRMRSKLPKVLHSVLFRPMLHHVLDLAKALAHQNIYVVVGHGEDQVRTACQEYSGVEIVQQKEQRGTAHAVMQLIPFLKDKKGHLLVLSGDVCLLRQSSIQKFLEVHEKSKAAVSIVTTHLPNPTGYGRMLRLGDAVMGIKEEADASAEEKKITEINSGIYCFDMELLFSALSQISNKNQQNEFYLTDTIEILVKEGKKVVGVAFEDHEEILGINDRAALADAERVLQTRINKEWMMAGVTLQNPSSIYIDPHCKLGSDVTIEAGTVLINSKIGEGTLIESYCRVVNSELASDVHLKQGTYVRDSRIGRATSVGPYAHLRPGTELSDEVKIGNFVEVKKSHFASGSKASHLSYIGDAEIGKNANLGCGFVTCNYDGVNKHKTIIEEDVFIGSDSQTVAPVRIGRNSYVASGSTITEDVPPDSLALSRGRQVTKPGYAKKYPRDKKV